jgi:hypothetical protein
MQTWLYRLPQPVRAFITAVWVFTALFGTWEFAALDTTSDMTHDSIGVRLVVAAVAGLLAGFIGVAAGDRRLRRIYGSTDQAITYARVLRTGHLPTGIEPAAWQRWLEVSKQSMRWTPVTVAVLAVLAVLNALDHQWALPALLAAFAMWFFVYQRVLRRRIARLATAIDQRARAS